MNFTRKLKQVIQLRERVLHMRIRFWVVCDEKGEVITNSPNFKTQKGAYKWIGENLNPGRYELCLIDWVGNLDNLDNSKNILFETYLKVKCSFDKTINLIKGE